MGAADGRQQMWFTVICSMGLNMLHTCVTQNVKD